MCYDIKTLTQRGIKYAMRQLPGDPEKQKQLELEYEELLKYTPPIFHASGFEHPLLPVITSKKPDGVRLLSWGLIPHWCRNDVDAVKLSNQTLNARAETLFEKPSFRLAARSNRCLIAVDGFYEHHHFNRKSYPFLVTRPDRLPFFLAGISDTWISTVSGMQKETVSIVTVPANTLLKHIHNRDAEGGSRMPLIINAEDDRLWLGIDPGRNDEKALQNLMVPYRDELTAVAVHALRGKNKSENNAGACEPFVYPELSTFLKTAGISFQP